MKRLIPLITITLFFVSGCVGSTPSQTRSNSRSGDAQRERARQAFDELEGRPTTPSTPAARPAPEPVLTPRPTTAAVPPVAKPSAAISKSTHLIAQGYGQSRPEAIRRAKAELANIFESHIESDISSVTRAATDSANGQSLSKNVQSKIRVASSVELEGVEVGSVTKEGREYTAVAALNRARAAKKWQHEVDRLTARIKVEERAAANSPGKLMTLKHLNGAMALFIEREALVSRLRVIGYPAKGADEAAFESLVAQLQTVKTHFRINLEMHSSSTQTLSRQLAKELTQAGFVVGDSSRTSDATLRVTLALSKVKNNNPNFKFMRAVADVSIIDPTTGKMVGHLNENQRGAHLTYEEAGVKAVGKLAGQLSEKIVAYFN